MARSSGPYYTLSTQATDDHENQDEQAEATSIYPDLGQSTAPDDRMYALADDALHVHQTDSIGHLAGLIQAATAAASQDDIDNAEPTKTTHGLRRTTRQSQGIDEQQDSREQNPSHTNTLSSDSNSLMQHARNARKRKHLSTDGTTDLQARDPLAMSDEAGFDAPLGTLQSGSALFRRTSTTSKKYTRPPMSKLFTSLELSPEGFLQLQAKAKAYMLNDAYPDRKETVGQRGKGDSELVKLRLWTCVKEFLEAEGNGNLFFGSHVQGDEGIVRTMFWPTHKNNIISAVMPLLRRMVTNERQRRYAVETRKVEDSCGESVTKRRKLNNRSQQILEQDPRSEPHPHSPAPDHHEFFLKVCGADLEDYVVWTTTYKDKELIMQLDKLGVQSGLTQTAYNGLVATIDHHCRMFHGAAQLKGSKCSTSCEDEIIDRILGTGYLDSADLQSPLSLPISERRHQ